MPEVKSTRTVPMKVLVLGCGRTGTNSMWTALKRLGYLDTHHMVNIVFGNFEEARLWTAALDTKYGGAKTFDLDSREAWDQMLGNCQAVTDFPGAAFGPELMRAYPEAKVILTSRDVDSWHRSVSNTIYAQAADPMETWLEYVDYPTSVMHPMHWKLFNYFFDGDFPNKGKQVFLRHNDEIRRLAPEDRFLEYQVGQGWEPLCEFLGEPVPDIPFPNTNDSGGFNAMMKTYTRVRLLKAATRLASTAAVVAAGVWVVLPYVRKMR